MEIKYNILSYTETTFMEVLDMKKIIGIIMVVLTTSIFAQDTKPKTDQGTAVVERVSVQVSNSRQLTTEEQREFYSIGEAGPGSAGGQGDQPEDPQGDAGRGSQPENHK